MYQGIAFSYITGQRQEKRGRKLSELGLNYNKKGNIQKGNFNLNRERQSVFMAHPHILQNAVLVLNKKKYAVYKHTVV